MFVQHDRSISRIKLTLRYITIMFVEYWSFITRELPTSETPIGIETVPHFYYKTVLWSLFFCALNFVVPFLAKRMFPKWYGSLSDKDQREFPSYAVCLIHHVIMVPIAWVRIYHDVMLSSEMAAIVDYATAEAGVGPFCIGYLVGDTLCFATQEALALRFEFIVHHFLTISLVMTAIFGPGNLLRYIPHLLICDTTNIFFNSAWLLRRCGLKGSFFVTALEVLFAVTFLLTRVINLPAVFLQVTLDPRSAAWGWARYTLLPISLMQWYWFSKIAATLLGRMSGGKKKSIGDKSASRDQRKRA